MFIPLTLIVKHAPIAPINIDIKAAISTNILSYQLSFIPSCFLVLPTPTIMIGTSAIIRMIKNGIAKTACWLTDDKVLYNTLFIAILSTYSKSSSTAV